MGLRNHEITYKALNEGVGVKSCHMNSASATGRSTAKGAAAASLLLPSFSRKGRGDLFVFGEIIYSRVNSEDSSGVVTQAPPGAKSSQRGVIMGLPRFRVGQSPSH